MERIESGQVCGAHVLDHPLGLRRAVHGGDEHPHRCCKSSPVLLRPELGMELAGCGGGGPCLGGACDGLDNERGHRGNGDQQLPHHPRLQNHAAFAGGPVFANRPLHWGSASAGDVSHRYHASTRMGFGPAGTGHLQLLHPLY